jgi:hypothetical protein
LRSSLRHPVGTAALWMLVERKTVVLTQARVERLVEKPPSVCQVRVEAMLRHVSHQGVTQTPRVVGEGRADPIERDDDLREPLGNLKERVPTSGQSSRGTCFRLSDDAAGFECLTEWLEVKEYGREPAR